MIVKIRFFAHFGEWVQNKSKIEIQVHEGATIRHVLNELFKIYNIRDKMFVENDNLREGIAILKNGREIKFLSGLETILDSNDEISIFPHVVGG